MKVYYDADCDINLITALPRASGAGLQLLTPDGWSDVLPPPKNTRESTVAK